MKIYTKGGDKGRTGIFGGERVDKDDIRIEANGCLDELNSTIGVVRSLLPENHEWHSFLFTIQVELMVAMSEVATPSALRDRNPNKIKEDMDLYCEKEIDRITAAISESEYFILPGGTPVSAHCQLARTVARRAERRLWTLHKQDPLPETVLRFVNRLSDLFFTMARYDMYVNGSAEERWKLFLYKR